MIDLLCLAILRQHIASRRKSWDKAKTLLNTTPKRKMRVTCIGNRMRQKMLLSSQGTKNNTNLKVHLRNLYQNKLAYLRVCLRGTYIGGVNSSLLEGAAGRVVGTQVAILAPVASEGTDRKSVV